jgi:hypothetical protein
MSSPRCYRCAKSASNPDGAIYVRREVAGRWGAVPICLACWQIEEPGRDPIYVQDRALRD